MPRIPAVRVANGGDMPTFVLVLRHDVNRLSDTCRVHSRCRFSKLWPRLNFNKQGDTADPVAGNRGLGSRDRA
jgi:hypothetical protein